MPKQTRYMIKQELERCINNLVKAQSHIVVIAPLYETTHVEIYDKLCSFVSILEQLKESIKAQSDAI